MNVYICTDLEAVAGVIDSLNWCYPEGRYFDAAKELLTLETNSAIEGFLAAGAKRIVVCDGHGWGGLDPLKLHPCAKLLAGSFGYVGYPLGLDDSFDVFAWVGQHAMAGTPFGHLAHTGSYNVLESTINGQPIGEIGQFAYVAAELGVRLIFLSGDRAAGAEAAALIPGIETVSVKEGLSAFQGLELTTEEAQKAFTAARHLSPQAARERIREGAERALHRAKEDPDMGRLKPLPPPYALKSVHRRGSNGEPGKVYIRSHPDSFIGVMNAQSELQP
jgi:D-amino peptidase